MTVSVDAAAAALDRTPRAVLGLARPRPTAMSTAHVHVTAGILTRDGKILACQRRADQSHGSKWEFPGGKCEAGESLEECLRRELREELGIEAEIGAEV